MKIAIAAAASEPGAQITSRRGGRREYFKITRFRFFRDLCVDSPALGVEGILR